MAGICTLRGVQMMTKKRLTAVKGMSEAKADKIKEAALQGQGFKFVTALEYRDQRKQVFKISTGSKELE